LTFDGRHYPEDLRERDMLAVLALAGRPLSNKDWTQALEQAGVENERRKAFSQAEVKSYTERFVAAKWVHETEAPKASYLTATASIAYLRDAVDRGRLVEFQAAIEASPIMGLVFERYTAASAAVARRIAYVTGDWGKLMALIERSLYGEHPGSFMLANFGDEPSSEALRRLPEFLSQSWLLGILDLCVATLRPTTDAVLGFADTCPTPLRMRAAQLEILLGRLDEVPRDVEPTSGPLEVLAAFCRGEYDQTYAAGEAAVASLKRRKYKQLSGLEGICHALACVHASSHGHPGAWDGLTRKVQDAQAAKAGFLDSYGALARFQTLAQRTGEPLDWFPLSTPVDWMGILVEALCVVWLRSKPPVRLVLAVDRWLAILRTSTTTVKSGIRREFEALDSVFKREPPIGDAMVSAWRSRPGWELALESLANAIGMDETRAPASEGHARIVWEIEVGRVGVQIQPREITSSRSSRGKVVSLTKLSSQKLETLSDADRRVLSYAERIVDPWRPGSTSVLGPTAVVGLIGHPHVVRTDGTRCEVVRGEPEIRVDVHEGVTTIRIHPEGLMGYPIAVEDARDRITVFQRSPALEKIVQALGGPSLAIPAEGRDQALRTLAKIAERIPIRGADLARLGREVVEADLRVYVSLRWDGRVLRVLVRGAPLGPAGPRVILGEGTPWVTAMVDGQLRQSERRLEIERTQLQEMASECPTLASLGEIEDELVCPDRNTALELLLELDAMNGRVVVTWPEGQSLATPDKMTTANFRIAVGERGPWLDVSATLQVDERTVLDFRELLEIRDPHGKFVVLDDERILALTADLRRRIDTLEVIATRSKTKGLRASIAALPLLASLAESDGLTLSPEVEALLARIRRIESSTPKVPRGFASILRDYQREGFVWMARLCEAGLGGVLADDMGLGKTIQTLALLVHRSKQGPALVVAPTSVVRNWQAEARRFAPTLRTKPLSEVDRSDPMTDLRAGDVLICSYTALALHAERLAPIGFATAVFDEAQALKNAQTQRSQAAFALHTDARLALTGTPIENHLGELWSLMQAVVPGLLGTEKHFQRRIAQPIATGTPGRSHQLRQLIRPFVLRRTRAQVLDELPSLTEIVVDVTPHADERAFYEALRRRALERVGVTGKRGAKDRFQILAEITRLRQAAVDPRLVDPETAPLGAKLDAVVDKLIALRDEGHRALVFTQFLGALQFLYDRLTAAGFEPLTLDGSTPARVRQDRIDAFQAGDADVFLMSLKAGGVGVNLTAADYVLHLDPWWNPAVEDQATGRAHRIGQQRPVTVLRFITEGTIEASILDLHAAKRDLADDLLQGLETAETLDLEALRGLLGRE